MMGLYLKKNSKMLIKSRLDVPQRTSVDLFPSKFRFGSASGPILLGNRTKLLDVKNLLQFGGGLAWSEVSHFNARVLEGVEQFRFGLKLMSVNSQISGR